MKAQNHYIQPGDRDSVITIAFSLAELKTLQGLVIESIEQDAKVNEAHQSKIDLSQKLEYWITDTD